MSQETRVVPDYDRLGYALAMRVLQSDLYRQLDDRERAECDALIAAPATLSADEFMGKVLSGHVVDMASGVEGEGDKPAEVAQDGLSEAPAALSRGQIEEWRKTWLMTYAGTGIKEFESAWNEVNAICDMALRYRDLLNAEPLIVAPKGE